MGTEYRLDELARQAGVASTTVRLSLGKRRPTFEPEALAAQVSAASVRRMRPAASAAAPFISSRAAPSVAAPAAYWPGC